MNNKELIKKRFSLNFSTYDEYAIVQKNVVTELTKLVPFKEYQKVLEIGCGTGLLTKKLDYLNAKKLYLNDLSEDVKNYIKIRNLPYEFLIGDAEKIDFPQNLDLIISANAIQWFDNPKLFFDKVFDALNENGLFIFSTYISGNCREIADIFGVSLAYKTQEELFDMLSKNFVVKKHLSQQIVLNFENLKYILKHIKNTGVNAISHNTNFTKSIFNLAQIEYEKLRNEKGLPLTYVPAYFVAQKN